MENYSFFKKTLTILSLLQSESPEWILRHGWLTYEELERIIIILEQLKLVKRKTKDWITITDKGLRILAYFKMKEEYIDPRSLNLY
jgi:hypothetical protein